MVGVAGLSGVENSQLWEADLASGPCLESSLCSSRGVRRTLKYCGHRLSLSQERVVPVFHRWATQRHLLAEQCWSKIGFARQSRSGSAKPTCGCTRVASAAEARLHDRHG